MKRAITGVAALVLLWGAAVRADDLQVYEALIYQDRYLKPQPWLATAWKNIDPVTWELTLREVQQRPAFYRRGCDVFPAPRLNVGRIAHLPWLFKRYRQGRGAGRASGQEPPGSRHRCCPGI
nr:hypothetical protein [Sodalis glossinidius]